MSTQLSQLSATLPGARVQMWRDAMDCQEPILAEFGTWIVTESGVWCIGDKDGNFTSDYISKQVFDKPWPRIMAADTLQVDDETVRWVEMWDFLRAFYWARHHFEPDRYPSLEDLGMVDISTKGRDE